MIAMQRKLLRKSETIFIMHFMVCFWMIFESLWIYYYKTNFSCDSTITMAGNCDLYFDFSAFLPFLAFSFLCASNEHYPLPTQRIENIFRWQSSSVPAFPYSCFSFTTPFSLSSPSFSSLSIFLSPLSLFILLLVSYSYINQLLSLNILYYSVDHYIFLYENCLKLFFRLSVIDFLPFFSSFGFAKIVFPSKEFLLVSSPHNVSVFIFLIFVQSSGISFVYLTHFHKSIRNFVYCAINIRGMQFFFIHFSFEKKFSHHSSEINLILSIDRYNWK